MILPPFSLPSNPIHKITLREATVADALDFCDADPRMEEAVTTLFLNRVQQKEGFLDARKWTMDDRRLGLYWYWMHTTENTVVDLSFTCAHCNEQHTLSYDMRRLADGYQRMKGKPEREITFENERILVRPLNGEDAEALEALRLESDETPKGKANLRLSALARTITFFSMKPDEDRVKYNIERIRKLSMTQMRKLAGQIDDKIAEMAHGLETAIVDGVIYVLVEAPCETKKEEKTLLRVPFRDFDPIPIL